MKIKNYFWIALVLLFTSSLFAESDYKIFVYNGKAGLLDSDFNVVMEPNKKSLNCKYSYIYSLTYPSVISIFDENLELLYQNRLAIDYFPISDRYFFIKTNTQNIVFDFEYKNFIYLEEDLTKPLADIHFDKEKYLAGNYGYFTGSDLNDFFRNDDYTNTFPFNNKRAVVIMDSRRFEIIDDNLNVVKNDVIQCAKNYSEGLLAVKTKDGKSGFINTAGEYVFNTDFYVENLDYSPKLIPELDAYFSEGVACVQTGKNKWVIYDKTGKSWNINPELKIERNTFSDGMLLVSKKDLNNKTKYGFIDKTGKEKIPCVLDSSAGFYNGIAAVVYEGKEAVLDLNGNLYFSADLMKGNKKAALKL